MLYALLNFLTPFIFSTMTIIWSLPFILSSIFGWSMIKISSTKIKYIYPHVYMYSIRDGDEYIGWIAGLWFIGYIIKTNGDRNEIIELYIFMNVNKSKHIFDGAIQTEVNNKHISYWERSGNSYGYRYDNREISYLKLEPYENQKLIISKTIKIMNEKESKTSVVLLSGLPGTGKSTIATFLAKELLTNKSICQNTINQVQSSSHMMNLAYPAKVDKVQSSSHMMNLAYPAKVDKVHYIDTFNPTTPGDEFSKIYRKINPTSNSPLIIVLEEIDIIIDEISDNIPNHKYIPIQIRNKLGWNIWFDKLDKGFYPHVYVIMTTNKPINYFDKLDESYMRNNRVNLKAELLTDEKVIII
jgi:hypothetical protein